MIHFLFDTWRQSTYNQNINSFVLDFIFPLFQLIVRSIGWMDGWMDVFACGAHFNAPPLFFSCWSFSFFFCFLLIKKKKKNSKQNMFVNWKNERKGQATEVKWSDAHTCRWKLSPMKYKKKKNLNIKNINKWKRLNWSKKLKTRKNRKAENWEEGNKKMCACGNGK